MSKLPKARPRLPKANIKIKNLILHEEKNTVNFDYYCTQAI